MSSKIEIWNMALGHLGQEEEVQDEAEDTSYANMCRRYWDTILAEEFEGDAWTFLKVSKDLALIDEDPNDEWGYSYEYPADCGFPLRIYSGARRDTLESKVPYEIVNDRDNAVIIYTDQEDATLDYVLDETTTVLYPASFKLCLSYKLAFMIALKLVGGNPGGPQLRSQMYELYLQYCSKAKANDASKIRRDPEPESEFTRNR